MSIIISNADLRTHYSDMSRKCHDTGEPIFVTKDGEVDIVMLSIKAYDALAGTNALRNKILRGLAQAKADETQPYGQVAKRAREITG